MCWLGSGQSRDQEAEEGSPSGDLCRLELEKNKLGKGMEAEVLGGARARVECVVEHFGCGDGERDGRAERGGYLARSPHKGLRYPINNCPRAESEGLVVAQSAHMGR